MSTTTQNYMMQNLAMNSEKPSLAIVAITPGGKTQALRLAALIPCDCFTSDKLVSEGFIGFNGSMAGCVQRLFTTYHALLFICATGITVRMIAPLVSDKLADPAVLVMDERAQHVISLLSGHVGGANQLTIQLASLLGASPVITTATDVNQLASLDLLIQSVGAKVDPYRQQIKAINQCLVSDQTVGLYLDQVSIPDTRGFNVVTDLKEIPHDLAALVIISNRTNLPNRHHCPTVQIIPKNIVVGIGCRRGTKVELIYQHLLQHLASYQIDLRAVKQIGSVIIKRDEEGLIALAEQLAVPFQVFSIETLQAYEHLFPISEFVRKTIGIGSVSQPCAWVMSKGTLLGETVKHDGTTITLGVSECYI